MATQVTTTGEIFKTMATVLQPAFLEPGAGSGRKGDFLNIYLFLRRERQSMNGGGEKEGDRI